MQLDKDLHERAGFISNVVLFNSCDEVTGWPAMLAFMHHFSFKPHLQSNSPIGDSLLSMASQKQQTLAIQAMSEKLVFCG